MNNTITYEQYLSDYRALDPGMKRLVRRVGSLELESRGIQEIGSSDVSCAVFSLYQRMKSFDDIIRYGLELIRELA